MPKFHISANGQANPCNVTVGICPRGGATSHGEFPDAGAAQSWAEAKLSEEHNGSFTPSEPKKRPARSSEKPAARRTIGDLLKTAEGVAEVYGIPDKWLPPGGTGFIKLDGTRLWSSPSSYLKGDELKDYVKWQQDREIKGTMTDDQAAAWQVEREMARLSGHKFSKARKSTKEEKVAPRPNNSPGRQVVPIRPGTIGEALLTREGTAKVNGLPDQFLPPDGGGMKYPNGESRYNYPSDYLTGQDLKDYVKFQQSRYSNGGMDTRQMVNWKAEVKLNQKMAGVSVGESKGFFSRLRGR